MPKLLYHARIQDGDTVAHRHRLHLIVGDIDECRPRRLVQSADLRPRLHPQFGVQIRERLVQQKHLWVAHQRAAQRHPLPLAAG